MADRPGSSGSYALGGTGLLSVSNTCVVGVYGSGSIAQSGGTCNINTLVLGSGSGGTGSYTLSGSGLLSAANELVGSNSAATAWLQQSGGSNAATYLTIAGGCHYQQSGGSNTVAYLTVSSGGLYQLYGGTLQVASSFINGGVVDGGNLPATLNANCTLDLTSGTWENLQGMSVNLGVNALTDRAPGVRHLEGFRQL